MFCSMGLFYQISQYKAYSDAINLNIEQIEQFQDLHSTRFINLDPLLLLIPQKLSNNSVSLFLQQFKPSMEIFQFKCLIKL